MTPQQQQQMLPPMFYANVVEVFTFGPEDFYVDLGLAKNQEHGDRVARIILPPVTAKALSAQLAERLAAYEQAYGELFAGQPDAPDHPKTMARPAPIARPGKRKHK